ncbi:Uncharacterised protein [Mycobacteroides abscessus subsp. abscessus]|nr:Uncharacterised protein [Mycobacteroides abscessus subsp. abscessus]
MPAMFSKSAVILVLSCRLTESGSSEQLPRVSAAAPITTALAAALIFVVGTEILTGTPR